MNIENQLVRILYEYYANPLIHVYSSNLLYGSVINDPVTTEFIIRPDDLGILIREVHMGLLEYEILFPKHGRFVLMRREDFEVL